MENSASVLERCCPIKRGQDVPTSSTKNKKTCIDGGETTEISGQTCIDGGETTEISGVSYRHTNQGVWSELSQEVASNMSQSVVSLALSDGYKILFACSGIALERKGNITRFVTSASLARAFKDKRHYAKIEVCYQSNLVEGSLEEYDLDHGIAVVKTKTFLEVQGVLLNHVDQCRLNSKVVAVGCDLSGKLMATRGILISCGVQDGRYVMFSSCAIPQALEGGPLFDFDGKFVGMNLLSDMERSFFVPRNIILERWEHLRTSMERSLFLGQLKKFNADWVTSRPECEHTSRPEYVVNKDPFGDLDSLGYPKTSEALIKSGMILVNTFEETFGDAYGEGVWSKLSKKVSSNISRNVVALASFIGKRRFFACTGFFIEWNGCTAILTSANLVRHTYDPRKIVDNLRIEVSLPNKTRREGTLQHYSLHYNVALISVKDFHALCPANIQHKDVNCSLVVAVGRCFESGALMAARTEVANCTGMPDCRILGCNTCKITKAGIGGPLVDADGRFFGMNFCHQKYGTPCMFYSEILKVLALFQSGLNEGTIVTCPRSFVGRITPRDKIPHRPIRWAVPVPYWCHRDKLHDPVEDSPYEPIPIPYCNGKAVTYL